MKLGILGGGLSAISIAYFLQEESRFETIDILERDEAIGGLARSYKHDGMSYDVGPHIVFSKNKEILEFMIGLMGDNANKIRRSNRIFYRGKFVKYPFENDLATLPPEDTEYCLNAFLSNPYEAYPPKNMLQFFLKVFGEGITNLYLRPYNEKIWKFDPAYLDLQMVERIPKPPAEDIIRSARGESSEGYLHQLYFHYPKQGGIGTIVDALARRLSSKISIKTNAEVGRISRDGEGWRVQTASDEMRFDRLISTIPITALGQMLSELCPQPVQRALSALRFNSIAICVLSLKHDAVGDNFAVMVPDKDIIFHRLSKLNFMGEHYAGPNGETVLLVEVTFRDGDLVSLMSDADLTDRIVADLEKAGLAKRADVTEVTLKRFKHAYVMYDLDHRSNMDRIIQFFEQELGILLSGRFGIFEYVNMDQVLEMSQKLAARVLAEPASGAR